MADFTGAKYAITTDCATHAIELCLRYLKADKTIEVPCNTYLSVPMMIEKTGLKFKFNDFDWEEYYYLDPYPIIDGSVHFIENCYVPNTFYCLSFQNKKRLPLGRGGAILTNDIEAYRMLSMMRYDGRSMPSFWADDPIEVLGYHYYMTPEIAEQGHIILCNNNLKPYELKGSKDYPDLRKMPLWSSRHGT